MSSREELPKPKISRIKENPSTIVTKETCELINEAIKNLGKPKLCTAGTPAQDIFYCQLTTAPMRKGITLPLFKNIKRSEDGGVQLVAPVNTNTTYGTFADMNCAWAWLKKQINYSGMQKAEQKAVYDMVYTNFACAGADVEHMGDDEFEKRNREVYSQLCIRIPDPQNLKINGGTTKYDEFVNSYSTYKENASIYKSDRPETLVISAQEMAEQKKIKLAEKQKKAEEKKKLKEEEEAKKKSEEGLNEMDSANSGDEHQAPQISPSPAASPSKVTKKPQKRARKERESN